MGATQAKNVNTSLRDAARHSGLFLLSVALTVLVNASLIVSPLIAPLVRQSHGPLTTGLGRTVEPSTQQHVRTTALAVPAVRSAGRRCQLRQQRVASSPQRMRQTAFMQRPHRRRSPSSFPSRPRQRSCSRRPRSSTLAPPPPLSKSPVAVGLVRLRTPSQRSTRIRRQRPSPAQP